MMRSLASSLIIAFSLVLIGCGPQHIKTAPNPIETAKQEFLKDYGFFVTDKEMKVFKTLATQEAVNQFIAEFFKNRDPDPSTPENEFQTQVDQRIEDIKDEILWSDVDLQGVRFDGNGGLKGDMAHVYLFYGMPNYKEHMNEGAYHSEMMVWYYFDQNGKQLFRFLFYKKFGTFKVFRYYNSFYMRDILKEISNQPLTSPEELNDAWNDFLRDDQTGAFSAALSEFSYYSDITVGEALAPPEPAAFVAQRLKPMTFGQPGSLEGRHFIFNGYSSFIPAKFVATRDSATGNPSFSLEVVYADLDWETKDKQAESVLNLRISFQNKQTKFIGEFATSIVLKGPQQAMESLIRQKKAITVKLDPFLNWAGNNKGQNTLDHLVNKELPPGDYVVNVYLQQSATKKSNAWREEVVVK